MMGRVQNQLVASILSNSVYAMKNMPFMLIQTVFAPISFLVLIFFVSGGTLLETAIVGGLIVTMFSTGTSLQHSMAHFKNDFKLQEMIVSSPTRSGVYVTGMAISELIYSLPALAILSVLFFLYVHATFLGVLGIAAVMLLVFIMSVSISFTLATYSTDIQQSWAYNQLTTVLFSTLAPVYYPITLIPEPWRYLAYLSPTTYAAQLAQGMAGLQEVSATVTAINWVAIISLTVFLMWFCMRMARWREV